jgi:hypothetical protein
VKEGVLQIFITLKNSSPWLVLNLQNLGPVASTLTITPPRQPVATLVSTYKSAQHYNPENHH